MDSQLQLCVQRPGFSLFLLLVATLTPRLCRLRGSRASPRGAASSSTCRCASKVGAESKPVVCSTARRMVAEYQQVRFPFLACAPSAASRERGICMGLVFSASKPQAGHLRGGHASPHAAQSSSTSRFAASSSIVSHHQLLVSAMSVCVWLFLRQCRLRVGFGAAALHRAPHRRPVPTGAASGCCALSCSCPADLAPAAPWRVLKAGRAAVAVCCCQQQHGIAFALV